MSGQEGTAGSITSTRVVHRAARGRIMHPTDARTLADHITWACDEADRLAGLINAAGLFIDQVQVTLPSIDQHHITVMVGGRETAP